MSNGNVSINKDAAEAVSFRYEASNLTQSLKGSQERTNLSQTLPGPQSSVQSGLGSTVQSQRYTGNTMLSNSKAVMSALRALQDKVRRVEDERDQLNQRCSQLESTLREVCIHFRKLGYSITFSTFKKQAQESAVVQLETERGKWQKQMEDTNRGLKATLDEKGGMHVELGKAEERQKVHLISKH